MLRSFSSNIEMNARGLAAIDPQPSVEKITQKRALIQFNRRPKRKKRWPFPGCCHGIFCGLNTCQISQYVYTQAASYLPELSMSRISHTAQFIPQVLRDVYAN